MGQKTHPRGFRIACRKDWDSIWYKKNKADYADAVVEDELIRRYLRGKLRNASVLKIVIERSGKRLRITIATARPGIIIGRKGQELESMKQKVEALTNCDVILDIQEVKKPEILAQLVSESVALQLERRVSFRRAMKKAIQVAMDFGVKGIRVRCAGRLGGADIARAEWMIKGSVPLHTLRANIDYGFSEADTIYGKIGVKCWVCTDVDK